MPPQEGITGVQLLHITKQLNQNKPVQVAFAVTYDDGNEEIQTATIPTPSQLFNLCLDQNWTQMRGPARVSGERTYARAV